LTLKLHQIKSAQTHARLLDVAMEVLPHDSYCRLSLHEVVCAAHMTAGAVQRLFGVKAACSRTP
jgi:hypothetical protein